MNDIQLFNYGNSAVRVVMYGNPPVAWFVAKDVCDILGYANSRKALADHLDDDEKDVTICYTPGGNQNVNIISSSRKNRISMSLSMCTAWYLTRKSSQIEHLPRLTAQRVFHRKAVRL